MNHDEIRFRVLSNLYNSQLDGRVKKWIDLDDVIEVGRMMFPKESKTVRAH